MDVDPLVYGIAHIHSKIPLFSTDQRSVSQNPSRQQYLESLGSEETTTPSSNAAETDVGKSSQARVGTVAVLHSPRVANAMPELTPASVAVLHTPRAAKLEPELTPIAKNVGGILN